MVRRLGNLLLGGASGACGLAAVGVALYAGGPAQSAAAALFAGFGFVAGLLCGGLHVVFEGLPAQPAAVMPPQALAGLVRATLATEIAERAPRAGSAAARRLTPDQLASAALAGAAATSMAAPSTPSSTTPMTAPTAAAAAAMARPPPAVARPSPAVAPMAGVAPPRPVNQRRFASSEFGA
jgi:hypothetical protein